MIREFSVEVLMDEDYGGIAETWTEMCKVTEEENEIIENAIRDGVKFKTLFEQGQLKKVYNTLYERVDEKAIDFCIANDFFDYDEEGDYEVIYTLFIDFKK